MVSRAAPYNILMRTTLPCSANAASYHGLSWQFQMQVVTVTAAMLQVDRATCRNQLRSGSPTIGSRRSLVRGLRGGRVFRGVPRLSAKPHLLLYQRRGGEGLIISNGTSSTAILMIGHTIPNIQLIPSNFGFGGGFGPGLRLSS